MLASRDQSSNAGAGDPGMIHNTNAAYIPSDKPRPIAGFPSVSALARHLGTTRQEAKRIMRQRAKEDRIHRETMRQIEKWEAEQ